MHILVVDDDSDTRDELFHYLTKHDLQVSVANGGPAMRDVLEKNLIDIIIMDLMMPEEDGLTLIKSLRSTSRAGIIILSGIGEHSERIVGLEIGADDYITKPCDLRELLARIRAVDRRIKDITITDIEQDQPTFLFADWSLDVSRYLLISPDNSDVQLTKHEFKLLKTFVSHRNCTLSRDFLLDAIHNREAGPMDRTIDNLVVRLRSKIEPNPKEPSFIKTVRGVGYIFTPKVTLA